MSCPSGPARSSTLGWPGSSSIGCPRYSALWREHGTTGLVVDAPDVSQRLLLGRQRLPLGGAALALDRERLLLQGDQAVGAHPHAHRLVGGAQQTVGGAAVAELAQ